MIRIWWLVAVVLGSIASTAVHADTAGAPTVMTYGAGTQSCGKWLAVRQTADVNWHGYAEWIEGWVSAVGQYAHLKQTDPYAMTAWVDNYCKEHPLDQLNVAALRLVQELSKPGS